MRTLIAKWLVNFIRPANWTFGLVSNRGKETKLRGETSLSILLHALRCILHLISWFSIKCSNLESDSFMCLHSSHITRARCLISCTAFYMSLFAVLASKCWWQIESSPETTEGISIVNTWHSGGEIFKVAFANICGRLQADRMMICSHFSPFFWAFLPTLIGFMKTCSRTQW